MSIPAVASPTTAEEVLVKLLWLVTKIEQAKDVAEINVAAGLLRQEIEGYGSLLLSAVL